MAKESILQSAPRVKEEVCELALGGSNDFVDVVEEVPSDTTIPMLT